MSTESWQPSPLACPECHGVLWQPISSRSPRFRCRVGHAFTLEALLAAQDRALESTLWTAVRLFEDRAAVCETFAADGGRFDRWAKEARQQAQALRVLLEGPVRLGPMVAECASGE
jgi:two-component system chemotaxis response regulator CheB